MRNYVENYEENLNDYKWALGLNQFSLQLMGVWPNETDLENENFFVLIRVPIMILIMLSVFLPQMYALSMVIHDLALVTDNLITSTPAITSCIKLYFIWRNKKVLWPVVNSAFEDWLRPKYDWELKAMKREAYRAKLFTIVGYIIIGGCYFGFAFAPVFGFDIRIINNITDYGNYALPTQSYYPYDYSKSPNLEITYLTHALGGLFMGMALSIPDNYFAALVLHISAQFQILGRKIKQIIWQDDEFSGIIVNNHFNTELHLIVSRHVHLMKMAEDIEKSFNFVLLAQLFCMSCMVCCLGFQILNMFDNGAEKPSPVQVLTLFATVFTLMMHTLANCYASELLATSSSELFHMAYDCKWYTLFPFCTRDLIPVMIASKNPRKLTAGKFICLSLPTFCSIMKTVAGYISMLIAVNKK